MTGGTELSMLWESVDPVVALAHRFGFEGVDQARSWLYGTLLEDWGVRVDSCERVVLSATSLLAWLTVDGRHVVAKCCADPSRFARLVEVDALVSWLRSRELPVVAALPARDGRLRVEREHLSVAVYPRVPGELLDVADLRQVRAAGRTLALLHRALAAYPGPLGGPPAVGRQLVHGDVRSANLLCDGDCVTAVLDFDEAAEGNRVTDLARAAVLLATRYHDWEPTSPATREAFLAAYSKVYPLTGAESERLVRGIAIVLDHVGWT